MKSRFNIRNAALVAALAAVAATAWAATEYAEPVVIEQHETLVTPAEPVIVQETVATTETVVVPATAAPAPVIERNAPITVEDRRLTVDQRPRPRASVPAATPPASMA